MSKVERDPKKRRVKPIEASQASILDFDLGESSDDSDFRIEDHPNNSEDDSLTDNTNDEGSESSVDEDEDSEDSDEDINNEIKQINILTNDVSVSDILKRVDKIKFNEKDAQLLICSGCLGDQSDGNNELIECDACGITVHEACYGVSDTVSLASTNSFSPTAPWFCEACKAGVTKPVCELCPNSGGIFKETDVGKWVHLVCALYIPGVAFGEVDQLTSVTLFEMPYNKWGSKACSLCADQHFSRTGVCIGCDAGMCRTYFHVTCAQREGFLSEAHSEEVEQADPFYAHCKLHSDKTLVKRRKRNYFALQLRDLQKRMQLEKDSAASLPEHLRILRKLEKQKQHYHSLKNLRQPPWVPTQKMPRLLTTSASACRKLLCKAELMGIDTAALEIQEAHVATLADIRKKWHISPAFTVEFIAYYLDRNDRLKLMKSTLEKLLEDNKILVDEQQTFRQKYDQVTKEFSDESRTNTALKETIEKYHSAILNAFPRKRLPNIEDIGKPPVVKPPQSMMVPTAAALKMGVGFPLNNATTGRVLSSQARQSQDGLLLKECGICRQRRDQYLLAKCDTCHLYYHLNCLNPPLTRLPKKSKLYGWQCSECDKSSDSEVEQVKAPRRSRSRYRRAPKFEAEDDDEEEEIFTPKVKIKPVEREPPTLQPNVTIHVKNYSSPTQAVSYINNETKNYANNENSPIVISSRSGKKRRREKHRSRYSPDDIRPSKEHKRKRKKKNLEIESPPHPRITIKIRSIPLPAGSKSSASNPQCFYVRNEENDTVPPPLPSPVIKNAMLSPALPIVVVEKTPPSVTLQRRMPTYDKKFINASNVCDVCNKEGTNMNLVCCDECLKGYHFTCLDPPLKKSPKKRGYSWRCSDCDPTLCQLPLPTSSTSNLQKFYVQNVENDRSPPHLSPVTRKSIVSPVLLPVVEKMLPSFAVHSRTSPKKSAKASNVCEVCKKDGNKVNLVSCDECLKGYHFACLEPPLKKSPKRRGYSWHCADCDPTDLELN